MLGSILQNLIFIKQLENEEARKSQDLYLPVCVAESVKGKMFILL